jgi:hypothetical protein
VVLAVTLSSTLSCIPGSTCQGSPSVKIKIVEEHINKKICMKYTTTITASATATTTPSSSVAAATTTTTTTNNQFNSSIRVLANTEVYKRQALK